MVRRILVVEDNDDCRQIIALYLSRMGCDVIQATNGLEGVEMAVNQHPDLILMDLKLPKLGGVEATTQLKENPVTSEIPVVICTAFGPEAYKDTPLGAKAAEIIQKPVKLETFHRMVEKYLPSQPETAEVFSPAA
ncbi:MAG: response regulator [Deltaproteobacteria bacterium]|nr:response regulator [Deltaproteobacteria bacterium]